MQVLARSLPFREGEIVLLDGSLNSYSFRNFGKTVGYVPQESEITFKYPVYDVVMMGRNPHLSRFQSPSEKDHEAVQRALVQTGTEYLSERTITSLSGGERQRVMIARILAQDPVLLLLDEPLAHIDIHHQYELIRIIRETSQGMRAVIGVFHDINLAAAYCDQLVLLNDGKIRAFGKPHEVLTEELMREIFRIKPLIGVNPATGTPWVYVADELKKADKKNITIHLISGGGSGQNLIPLLVYAGYPLGCGVLSENDTDCQIARQMDIPALVEPPFSRLLPETEELLKEQVQMADVVVVTSMPVGWGNYPNIRVLEQIDPQKIIFVLPESGPALADYTSGVATEAVTRLLDAGAMKVHSPAELFGVLQAVNDHSLSG